jgi:hypothetical protein
MRGTVKIGEHLLPPVVGTVLQNRFIGRHYRPPVITTGIVIPRPRAEPFAAEFVIL